MWQSLPSNVILVHMGLIANLRPSSSGPSKRELIINLSYLHCGTRSWPIWKGQVLIPTAAKNAEIDAPYSRIRPESHPLSPHATHAEWMAVSGRGARSFAHVGLKAITSMMTNRSGAISRSVMEAKEWRRVSQQGSCVCWIWHGQGK